MEGVKSFLGNWFSAGTSKETEESGETELMDAHKTIEVEVAEEVEEIQSESQSESSEVETEEDDSREVCKFYLENKCRFGNECRNKHEGKPNKNKAKKNKANNKSEEDDTMGQGKKPSMKTAGDVIKRLQWDPALPKEYFTVGYLDRFLGVLEENFTTFSWENLASVDYDVLAIPQHRIQYFKYKTEKVWEKKGRLDIVFGSTGSEVCIIEFMDQINEKIKEEKYQKESRLTFNSDEDSDSDDDDDVVAVTISPQMDSESKVRMINEEERSTHFLAIRVTNQDLIRNLVEVQEAITDKEEVLQECCMKTGLIHMTLAMLRLEGLEGIKKAVEIVNSLEGKLGDLLRDKQGATLNIQGLNNFGHRVVYAEVVPVDQTTFMELVNCIRGAVEREGGEMVRLTNSFEFVPHVTLAKVSRPVARLRRSKYIDTSSYDQFIDKQFGQQVVDNIQLCLIDSSTRHDGFYSTLAELKF